MPPTDDAMLYQIVRIFIELVKMDQGMLCFNGSFSLVIEKKRLLFEIVILSILTFPENVTPRRDIWQ